MSVVWTISLRESIKCISDKEASIPLNQPMTATTRRQLLVN